MTVEENKKNDEAEIQGLIDDCIRSLHDKNIEGVMSLYAPEVFFVYQGPIDYEVHDLTITVGDDVAFTHSLNRISGTMTTGQKTDLWLRWTACFRKINGKWLIVHHQNSVPVDFGNGKAVLDLKP